MSRKYLLDTNILIGFFKGELAVKSIFDEIASGNAIGFYCPITWIELLCYPELSETEAFEMREFLRNLICVSLTESVLDSAAQIRRERIKIADALIAACALVEGCTLVTRNVDDFKRVDGLIVLNPFDS
ncbi:MAG: type II toxin-antitoxin system VapC family toxin [Cyanomargarita calcarea GSE-NOS-MK-12-04C]|jgi:hypothetical protein|uniref:Type II toxin-antitoxin system VapC family toxin n=1 Tax=Cyanomargarita calcarea GSE-NOS-MK-12-04C TaxID=2839659 RepID=A0A951QHZ7_9CYAN|nr:type II toxin-antitoxin system VapC family toxin [Cyanomargarita calcarea GSE-NOS-MK-12-04C]